MIFYGCNLNVPEEWETPEWYIPLTMPLIDQIMGFEGILQDNILVVDSTTSQIQIEYPGELDPQGIPDSIFNIELDTPPITGQFIQEGINLDSDEDGKIVDYQLPSQDVDLSGTIASAVNGFESSTGADFTCFSPTLLSSSDFFTIPISCN